MAVTLHLDKMSVEEKIQTMEALWEDLCKSPEGVPSPEWHGKILKNREESVNRGDDEFNDWEDAKNKINDDIS
jgi:hypothetical protein